jgi:hypothetical protein
MESENNRHLYISGVVIVLLTSLLAAVSNMYSRILKTEEEAIIRIEKVEKSILNRDFLDQKFEHYDLRLKLFQQNCCSYVTERDLKNAGKRN